MSNNPQSPQSTTPRSPGDVAPGQTWGTQETPSKEPPYRDPNAQMRWDQVGSAPYADAGTHRGPGGASQPADIDEDLRQAAMDQPSQPLRQRWQSLRGNLHSMRQTWQSQGSTECIRQWPWSAVAVSLGAGFLFGYLLHAAMDWRRESDVAEIDFEPAGAPLDEATEEPELGSPS